VAASAASASVRGDRPPLEPLIHGRARLLVLSYLVPRTRGVPFTELRAAAGLTDGTLSVHLSKLEAGGIVAVEKRFVGKKPQTLVRMTDAGRRRFARYVDQLRQLVPGLQEE